MVAANVVYLCTIKMTSVLKSAFWRGEKDNDAPRKWRTLVRTFLVKTEFNDKKKPLFVRKS
jgi:hypothetical protein